jgi:hypothetical protein
LILFLQLPSKNFQITFLKKSYTKVPGITWNLNLNRAARAHCADRSTCPDSTVYAHNDCNNTGTGDRIEKFYGSWSGEIYWDYPYLGTITDKSWPYWAVAYVTRNSKYLYFSGWICDGSLYNNGQFKGCVADNGGNDGHRSIIMRTGSEVGCGVVFSGNNFYLWQLNYCR